ncbi:unnamed protein product [Euphydryas editha]|uniref:Uncharacterized protein n=1 Tax=Euphydryas editha TaxID=104508 RepID=A0AAU9UGR9_EUPED|nr:unnamed protein product [Euphydryas editha]
MYISKYSSVIIQLLWYSKIGLLQRWTNWYAPAIEKEHDPLRYTSTSSPFIEGTREKVPEPYESPDFRLEEPFYLPYAMGYYFEEERPYRISPHLMTTSRWNRVSVSFFFTAKNLCSCN